jgi:hypothetical protein
MRLVPVFPCASSLLPSNVVPHRSTLRRRILPPIHSLPLPFHTSNPLLVPSTLPIPAIRGERMQKARTKKKKKESERERGIEALCIHGAFTALAGAHRVRRASGRAGMRLEGGRDSVVTGDRSVVSTFGTGSLAVCQVMDERGFIRTMHGWLLDGTSSRFQTQAEELRASSPLDLSIQPIAKDTIEFVPLTYTPPQSADSDRVPPLRNPRPP